MLESLALKTLSNVYIILFSKGVRRIPPGESPRPIPPIKFLPGESSPVNSLD